MEKFAVSVREACDLIGIRRTKFYELVKQGRVKTFRIGRRTLVPVASIRAFIGELS